MNAILDVAYKDSAAAAACVRFRNWTDSQPSGTSVSWMDVPAGYVSGRFFERELPCLLHALSREAARFDAIVIDGFVHLKPPITKGLGAHLAAALPCRTAVIGVAKSPLAVADRFLPVVHGQSRRPLYVSAANMPLDRAAELIKSMHGAYRIPTLIKLADQLCRQG